MCFEEECSCECFESQPATSEDLLLTEYDRLKERKEAIVKNQEEAIRADERAKLQPILDAKEAEIKELKEYS
jgi:hypothetical protein